MSIDKESTGYPGMHPSHPDTKTNIGMVIGVIIFLLLGAVGVFWAIERSGVTDPGHGVEQR